MQKIRDIAQSKMAYGFWPVARARAKRINGDFSRASAAFFAALRTPAALVTASEEFSTARAMKRRAGANLVKTARIGPRDSLPDSPSASECSAQFFLPVILRRPHGRALQSKRQRSRDLRGSLLTTRHASG